MSDRRRFAERGPGDQRGNGDGEEDVAHRRRLLALPAGVVAAASDMAALSLRQRDLNPFAEQERVAGP